MDGWHADTDGGRAVSYTHLVPSIVASGLIFGMRAILLTAVTTLACVVFEYLYCKLMHKPNPVGDLSACVTGVIDVYKRQFWWMPDARSPPL